MAKKSEEPLVSISCLAYNQAKFIKQTLDSFLMQKTDFKFEVLIHDDASTDGTKEIIEEYEKKYPDIIKPIYEKENQWVKGKRGSVLFSFPRARGKYIALCEGDDYWTDPNKLQLQVDFLEKHPDYALCFHPVEVFFENNEQEQYIFPKEKTGFTLEELLKRNFIQTNSVIYRKQDYKTMAANVMPADWYMHLYHAQFGKIGFINKVMSAYRRHSGGVWANSYKNRKKFWREHGLEHLNTYNELMKLYGKIPEYKIIIENSTNVAAENTISADNSKDKNLSKEILKKLPKGGLELLLHQHEIIDEQKEKLEKEKKELERQKIEINDKDKLIKSIERDIQIIKGSRFWKLRNKVARILGKEVV